MAENKRFTVDGLTIAENSPKGRKYSLEYQGGVNALCNRINGLFDKSKRFEKENEELKKQMNRLYNYFMDWHSDEMEGNQFSEMWDMVKESERWEEKW